MPTYTFLSFTHIHQFDKRKLGYVKASIFSEKKSSNNLIATSFYVIIHFKTEEKFAAILLVAIMQIFNKVDSYGQNFKQGVPGQRKSMLEISSVKIKLENILKIRTKNTNCVVLLDTDTI